MEGFMNGMQYVMDHGIYVVLLWFGMALILVGLFRSMLMSGLEMGESALSALGILLLCVLLLTLVPVSGAFSTLVGSIPIIGDVMDYGTVLSLLKNDPLGALVAFVDCFILMLIMDLFGGLTRVFNPVTRLFGSIVSMVLAVAMLEAVKALPLYENIVTAIYGLAGLSIVAMVLFMFFAIFFGTALPGFMMLMPACIRCAVYKTMLILLALFIVGDVFKMDLTDFATLAVRTMGAFAPVALMIFALVTLLLGVL